MTDQMPPDPFLLQDPHGDSVKNAAGQLHLEVRRMADAAATLGLDTERWHRMIYWADLVNGHFNPAVRIQHGRPAG